MLDEENVFDMLQAAKDHKIEMKETNMNKMTILDDEEVKNGEIRTQIFYKKSIKKL